MILKATLCVLVVILLAIEQAQPAWANSEGPLPGMTGVPAGQGLPAEMTCQSCHMDFPLNPDAHGKITLLGVPTQYVAAQTYLLTVRLDHPTALRWGFQLTSVSKGTLHGAGSFSALPDDRSTQRKSGDYDRIYIEHGGAGRAATGVGTPKMFSWRFNWRAPDCDSGEIFFFGSANMANGDGSNTGDKIYTRSPEPLGVSRSSSKSGLSGALTRPCRAVAP